MSHPPTGAEDTLITITILTILTIVTSHIDHAVTQKIKRQILKGCRYLDILFIEYVTTFPKFSIQNAKKISKMNSFKIFLN